MQLWNNTIESQPEQVADSEIAGRTLRYTLVVDDDQAALEAAFAAVPWSRLISLRCDQQPGGGRLLSYRWRE
ncbi:MAG: hypothetical protein M3Q29_04910 [Chloroflexota bacterium]|nr:hypothetical protein [Chloroflexota bacterium]